MRIGSEFSYTRVPKSVSGGNSASLNRMVPKSVVGSLGGVEGLKAKSCGGVEPGGVVNSLV